VEAIKLEQRVGFPIRVFCRDGREIRGVLKTCDEHQNLVLEEAEELGRGGSRRHRLLFVKGGNIRMIEI